MIYLIITGLLFLLIYFPNFWIKYVLKKYSKPIADMPGTGGELAKHLIERFELEGVVVEETGPGQDHFSPLDKAVRLSPSHYNGKSLTAIAVAAHEVGHAIQFHRNEKVFELRSRYLPIAAKLKQGGTFLLALAPLIALVIRAPQVLVGIAIMGIVMQLLGALAYLIVLPEEWDASFNKALPILKEGGYIHENHEMPIRQVLKAAALTYFAAALADVLNISRLIMMILRR